MTYKWDLMLRLLREVENSANSAFAPRQYAEEFALSLENDGQAMPNLDSLKAEAADYESLLFEGGFMVARPEEQGGTGENFILTERGKRLLNLLEDGTDQDRQHLNDKAEAALVPEVFDQI